jgi:hypothetical protein
LAAGWLNGTKGERQKQSYENCYTIASVPLPSSIRPQNGGSQPVAENAMPMHQAQPRPMQQLDPEPLVQQGFQALRTASRTPAELTIAVLSFHIAADQICRQLLATDPQLPPTDRATIWTEDVSWPRLMELMRRYAKLSHAMAELLHQLNRERNDLCHRQPRYQGMEEQVLRYGDAAEQLLFRLQAGSWSPLAPGFSELEEMNLAALDRERARVQHQSEDALLEQLLLQGLPETE